jgi:DNA replication protein DnaD
VQFVQKNNKILQDSLIIQNYFVGLSKTKLLNLMDAKTKRGKATHEEKELYVERMKKLRTAIDNYKRKNGKNFLKQVEIHFGRELTKKERQDIYNALNGHSCNYELIALLEKIFL